MTLGFRNPSTLILRLGLVMMLAAGLTGCAGLDMVSQTLFPMTPEQEVQFGSQVAKQVQSQAQLVSDETVVNYVRAVGGRIAQTAPHSDVPIRFYVVKDDSINAFAIPGGNIYVNTGLLRAADDEAELASVIAHEIGHVVRRHAAKQVSRTMGVQTLQQLAMGGNSPQSAKLVSDIIAKGYLTDFSREDELEADKIAVHTLYNAGYDPNGLKRLFTKLTQGEGRTSSAVRMLEPISKLISTHPPTQERIMQIDTITRSLPLRPYQPVTNDLRKVQGRLKQLGLI